MDQSTSPATVPGPLPTLTRAEPADAPRAVVLALHGGAQHGHRPVAEGSASYWRMCRLVTAIGPGLLAEGYAVWLLRFAVRGWNDPADPSPIPDARWALERIRETHGDLPVALLGHSMGARTAAHVADDPAVRGLVALAPWFQPEDPVEQLAGRMLLAGHGRRDRITRAAATRAYLARAEQAGCRTGFTDLGPVGHYLLRAVPRWHEFAVTGIRTVARSGRALPDHEDCT